MFLSDIFILIIFISRFISNIIYATYLMIYFFVFLPQGLSYVINKIYELVAKHCDDDERVDTAER